MAALIEWRPSSAFRHESLENLYINGHYAHTWVSKEDERKWKVTMFGSVHPFGDQRGRTYRSLKAAKEAMHAQVIALRMEGKV